MSKVSLRLSEETIRTLGRAVTDKADLIYQAYSPNGCYELVNDKHKQYQILQDSGVISINPNNITLGSNFTAILKNLDRKSRNANIAPDIELSKHQISNEVALAQIQSDSFEDESEEMMHLANIGVMDIFHAVIVPKAIYCLYLQGINAMNQKTALFVVTNTSRKMDASSANNSTNA